MQGCGLELWSGWNRVEKQVQKIDKGERKKPKLGNKRGEWEVRQDFTVNEAILGRCAFDFSAESRRGELEFEAIERVKLGETGPPQLEEAWIAREVNANVKEVGKRREMWVSFCWPISKRHKRYSCPYICRSCVSCFFFFRTNCQASSFFSSISSLSFQSSTGT